MFRVVNQPETFFIMIEKSILKKLVDICGKDNVFTDSEILSLFSRDETEKFSFLPDVVVKPDSAGKISSIVKLANEIKMPVIPRGGGTGLSGGSLAVKGGIMISMEKFNKILNIDKDNFQASVEPGVITQVFQETLEKYGLYYPVDPASKGSCFLGGNLAENSGGPRAVKYGTTKDYVLSIEFVSPQGKIIQSGASTIKNVTGYNLSQLIIGSEGTLGIITKITFRVLPIPLFKKLILVAFDSPEKAAAAVSEIFINGVIPSALEFLEKDAIKITEKHIGRLFPNSEYDAHLLIELDGYYNETLELDIEKIAEVLYKFDCSEIILADTPEKMESLWILRRAVGEAVKSISQYREEDTVVPRSKLPELLKGVKEICSRYNIRSICYGHAGDGNLHINLLKEHLDDNYWNNEGIEAVKEIFRHTVSLGGTISGEHGIGYSQKNYLNIALTEDAISLMKTIKQSLDPNNILNPGKIFI